MDIEAFDLRDYDTLERPEVRDLFERGPLDLAFLISLMSNYVP